MAPGNGALVERKGVCKCVLPGLGSSSLLLLLCCPLRRQQQLLGRVLLGRAVLLLLLGPLLARLAQPSYLLLLLLLLLGHLRLPRLLWPQLPQPQLRHQLRLLRHRGLQLVVVEGQQRPLGLQLRVGGLLPPLLHLSLRCQVDLQQQGRLLLLLEECGCHVLLRLPQVCIQLVLGVPDNYG
jgi:hypothetical protein